MKIMSYVSPIHHDGGLRLSNTFGLQHSRKVFRTIKPVRTIIYGLVSCVCELESDAVLN